MRRLIMINSYTLKIGYTLDGKPYASSNLKTGHYTIDENFANNTLTLKLNSTIKMRDIVVKLEYDYNFNNDSFIYPSGYQSWTDSMELTRLDKMPPLSAWANTVDKVMSIRRYGDYNFTKYIEEPGFFHGVSYSYIRHGDSYELIGSLCERTGYTIMYFNCKDNKIVIEKDLEGITLEPNKSYNIMDLFYAKGEYDTVFDNYFKALKTPKPKIKSKCGYTSWYNYFNKINENIITRDLESLSTCGHNIDIFQIDDGFQTAVGDWLSIDSVKFPNGMKSIADKIHEKNMLAGLWLAPFSAQRSSQLYLEHPDWFIKNYREKTLCMGGNWGGFYGLDFYKEEPRKYIKQVFNTVLKEWGFDMVKLDFLYCVCAEPMFNKTRGQIMCDAMDFIRECVGDKLILGCGVPLFPAFGKVDFCRTGCDVSLNWAKKLYFTKFHREDVSTENSVKNTIFRRHLDGRAFVNDPDVFLLRDNNIKLNLDQRALLAKINKLFGNLLFISDNIADYSDAQRKIFDDTITPCDKKINKVTVVGRNLVNIDYSENGINNNITIDIKKGVITEGNI